MDNSEAPVKTNQGLMVVVKNVVKLFLGKLSTKELYISLIKYIGEALGVAFFKSIGEVVFGMGDVLRGESSWYNKSGITSPSTPSTSAFASARPTFSSTRHVPAPITSKGFQGGSLDFPGF